MTLHWFHHPITIVVWYVTYAVWFIPEIILSRRRHSEDAQPADRGSKIVVITAVNLAIILGFVAAFKVPSLSLEAHWKILFTAGIAVWLLGILFRWYSIFTLGRFFTTEIMIAKNQQVVERGPYRWLRHPAYLGSLVAMIGFGMTLANWLALIVPAFCVAMAYAYRIPIEEQTLVSYLGSDYSNYMQRTWRLIPYVF
jgi:protein-S-isoprenylcysteine O-methyltransferase Ste14